MTKEEAVKMLKSKMDGHTDTSYEWAETVRMAIKALEQEPCDDVISRQAVLDLYKKKGDDVWVKDIKNLPPVTPQLKMGRWAILKDEYGDVCEAVCSCCDKNGNHKWAFCPFCGCKMQEVEENEKT